MQTRILDIYARYSEYIHRLVPLQIEDEYLKIVIYFADGSNLRVAEEWDGDMLVGYSYYWLTPDNQLKIGWDNAPHHAKLENFPHHKHVGQQANRQPSHETCLLGRGDAGHHPPTASPGRTIVVAPTIGRLELRYYNDDLRPTPHTGAAS